MEHKITRVIAGHYKHTTSDNREFHITRYHRGRFSGWKWKTALFQEPQVESTTFLTLSDARGDLIKWIEKNPVLPAFPCCDDADNNQSIFEQWRLNFCPFCGKKLP